jgi:hypothetical protein
MQRVVKYKYDSYLTNVNEVLNKIYLHSFYISFFLFIFFEFFVVSFVFSLSFLYIFEIMLFSHFYMRLPHLLKEYFVVDDKKSGPLVRSFCRLGFLIIAIILFFLQDDHNMEFFDDFDFALI